MTIFVDTSAFHAFVDEDDADHEAVSRAWDSLWQAGATLLTTNYVVTETIALMQNRLGLAAVRAFVDGMIPVLRVEWVEPESHEAATEALLAANRRDLSLVDCISFVTMRRLGLKQAWTLDPHFSEQGFECLPAPVRP